MSEHKTGKYLKYAIGEIVLVVIGILIALQINNWNEGRKLVKHEINVLKQLKQDFEDNLTEIKGIQSKVNDRFNAVDSIFSFLNTNKAVNDSAKFYFQSIYPIQYFNSANTTYKYVESSGLNVLSNDALRADITNMYETEFKNIHIRIGTELRLKENQLRPIVTKLFEPSISQNETSRSRNIYALNTPIDVDLLRENIVYRNYLTTLKIHLNIQKRRFPIVLTKLNTLIEDINSEIERLEQ